MRIVMISDTHSCQSPPPIKRTGYVYEEFIVPDGDILIHAGDLTESGSTFQTMQVGTWMSGLPHKYKIFLAGNHDFSFEKNRKSMEEHFPGCIYLENSGIEIEGLKIWGSPQTPWYGGWAFNAKRGADIKKYWDMIPDDTNVLITHGPPKGILDFADIENAGCQDLLDTIFNRLGELKLHVFGHIHQGYGAMESGSIEFRNAAIQGYRKRNAPLIIDL